MYYEINVSLNGTHFFATAPRSLTTKEDARAVLAEFDKVFTEERGFVIMVEEFHLTGEYLNLDVLRGTAPQNCEDCGQKPGGQHAPGCKDEPQSAKFR